MTAGGLWFLTGGILNAAAQNLTMLIIGRICLVSGGRRGMPVHLCMHVCVCLSSHDASAPLTACETSWGRGKGSGCRCCSLPALPTTHSHTDTHTHPQLCAAGVRHRKRQSERAALSIGGGSRQVSRCHVSATAARLRASRQPAVVNAWVVLAIRFATSFARPCNFLHGTPCTASLSAGTSCFSCVQLSVSW